MVYNKCRFVGGIHITYILLCVSFFVIISHSLYKFIIQAVFLTPFPNFRQFVNTAITDALLHMEELWPPEWNPRDQT